MGLLTSAISMRVFINVEEKDDSDVECSFLSYLKPKK